VEVREKLILSGLVLATGISGAMWFRKTDALGPLASNPAAHTVRREEYRPNPAPIADAQAALPKPVPLPNPSGAAVTAPPNNSGRVSLEGTPPPSFSAEYQPFFQRTESSNPAATTTAPPFVPGGTTAQPFAPSTSTVPFTGSTPPNTGSSAPAFGAPIQTAIPRVYEFKPLQETPRSNATVAAPPNWPEVNRPAVPSNRPTAPPTLPAAPANSGATTTPRSPTLPPAGNTTQFPAFESNGVTPSSYSSQVSVRRHKVADGETLGMIAEHYLGSSSRRLEIFQANRDILKDPEVLPIGADLAIPAGPSPWGR